jgi:hypothetical protein
MESLFKGKDGVHFAGEHMSINHTFILGAI